MSWSDLGLLILAVLAVFGPGAALLAAGLGRGRLETLAAAPAVTVALCYVTALLTGLTGLAWGAPAVVVATAIATAAAWLARRRWAPPSTGRPPLLRRELALPVGGLVLSVALGLWTFARGFGRLSVLPQEHDMVLQTLLAARIERTGEAAPWQSSPVDLLTGDPAGFYPNGVHMLASLAAPGNDHTVGALNAVTVVLFAMALPTGIAALARLLSPSSIRPVAMATAPLISVLAYRPVYAFLHDGGVLANAAALALVPGVAYAAITAVTEHRRGAYATTALGVVGALVVHPTAAPTIAITAGAWIMGALVLRLRSTGDLVRAVAWLAVAAVAAVLLLVPFLVVASTTAGFVTSFPRGTPPSSLGGALGTTLSFYYGGFFDAAGLLSQAVLALVSLIGVGLCLYRRSNLPLLVTYAAWLGILLLWLVKPGFPVIATLGGIYYNSYGRFSGGLSLIQWLVAAVAIGYLAEYLARGARRIAATERWTRLRPAGTRLAPFAGAIAVLLFLAMIAPYAATNALTLQQRYRYPEFERVDEDDLAAGRFLAENVEPGQRVMNNANDGSTYAYVFSGVPLVNTSTLASPYAPYTEELLLGFDDLEGDEDIRELVCSLDIAWVMADENAPMIGAPGTVTPLGDDGVYATPPGFRRLDRLDTVEAVYTHGDVTVYSVDLDQLGCTDS